MIDVGCAPRGKGSAATVTQRNDKKIREVGVVLSRFDAREITRVPGPKLVGNDIGYFRAPITFTVELSRRVVCSETTGVASGIC